MRYFTNKILPILLGILLIIKVVRFFINRAHTIVEDSTLKEPIFTDDTLVFGLLMLALGFIFYTESLNSGFWHKFYKIVPGLFMAYMIPAVLTTTGLIAPEWETVNEAGEVTKHSTNLYYVASRYLYTSCSGINDFKYRFKSRF